MGLVKATLSLTVWFFVFGFALTALLPAGTRGWSSEWGLGDVVSGLVLIAGAWYSAPYCRSLSLYFICGAVAGFMYIAVHWPDRNDMFSMACGNGILIAYGLWWLGIVVGAGLACRFAASACHDRLDSRALERTHRCRKCGYLLYGLPEPRCPECGQPFAPALLRDSDDAARALQELADSQEGEIRADRDDEDAPAGQNRDPRP